MGAPYGQTWLLRPHRRHPPHRPSRDWLLDPPPVEERRVRELLARDAVGVLVEPRDVAVVGIVRVEPGKPASAEEVCHHEKDLAFRERRGGDRGAIRPARGRAWALPEPRR